MRKISKTEFIKRLQDIKEEKTIDFNFKERVGCEWSKLSEQKQETRSIRW
jgi:hypothetical protein